MARIQYVTVASRDPDDLAEFWAAAIDGERRDLPATVEPAIVDTPHDGPDLQFKDLPKEEQRDAPIHLDVSVDDREAAVERLQALGATVRETKTEQFGRHQHTWTVMEDPEGNGFCVAEQ